MTEQVALRTEIVYSGVSFSVWKVREPGSGRWCVRMAKVAPSAPPRVRLNCVFSRPKLRRNCRLAPGVKVSQKSSASSTGDRVA